MEQSSDKLLDEIKIVNETIETLESEKNELENRLNQLVKAYIFEVSKE